MTAATDIQLDSVATAYDRWAPVYDLAFGPVFRRGRALDEFARVLKPGGEMVLLTRIGAKAGLRRNIEHLLQPVVRKLGWRTEFSFERYRRWVDGTHDMRLVERRPVPPFGHFYLLRFAKIDPAAAKASAAA